MNINFENEIHSWLEQQDKRTAIPPNTIVIPSSQELFFEAKLTEIHRQYQAARFFLCQVDNPDWDYWYKPFNNEVRMESVMLDSTEFSWKLPYFTIISL